MGWSSYGFETVAAFAPEYHSPETDTPRALACVGGVLGASSTRCCRSGVGGTLGTDAVAADATFIAFYTQAFDTIVGNALGEVMIICLVAGPDPVDEHGDDGRLPGPVRDLQGRDDDQAARGA